MKRFKYFLDERKKMPIQVRTFLDSRAKPYEYWMSRKFNLPFPLSKPMMNRLGRGQENVKALHSTDASGLETLVSLQNTAKSISVFTKLRDTASGDVMVQGVETGGGVIVELKGDIAFKGNYDIFSSADNQGRRWIDLKQFSTPRMGMQRRQLIIDWHKTWMDYILDFTRRFINNNKRDLMDVYNIWIENRQVMVGGYSSSYMDYLDYATKTLAWARVFWIGSEGYMVDGMNKEESLNETGIVQKIQIAKVDLNHTLDRVATQSNEKEVIKGMFGEMLGNVRTRINPDFKGLNNPTDAYLRELKNRAELSGGYSNPFFGMGIRDIGDIIGRNIPEEGISLQEFQSMTQN